MSSPEVNSSIRESVLVSGTLRASTVLARCIVRAIKVTLPNLETAEYVKADVALAPPHMPDGNYELHFEGRMMKVRKSDGVWLSDDSRAFRAN